MTNINLVALSGIQLSETPTLIDDTTGLITVPTLLPVNQNHLSTKEYVDQTAAGYVSQTEFDTLAAGLAPKSEIARLESQIATKASLASLDALEQNSLPLTGGIMTGPILWSGPPTQPQHLVPKSYVDTAIGDQLSGALTTTAGDARYVNLTGDTLTGPVTLPSDPVTGLQAATKQYVDARTVNTADYVPLAGATMSGPLILHMNPSDAMGAATKQYVDGLADLRLNPSLAGFYTSGAIPIHLSRFSVVWDPADQTKIVGWKNRQGNTAWDLLFQAARPSLPYANNMVTYPGGAVAGCPKFATPYPLANKHVLFAMTYNVIAGTPNFMGAPDPSSASLPSGLRLQGSGTARLMFNDGEGGTLQAKALTGYYGPERYSVVQIYEFFPDYTARMGYLLINGVAAGNSAMVASDTACPLQYLAGVSDVITLSGSIGELMVVDTTRPDGAAALTFARSYLTKVYGITTGTILGD